MAECRLLLPVLADADVSNDVFFVSASPVRRCVAIAWTNSDVIVGTGAWRDTGKSVWSWK